MYGVSYPSMKNAHCVFYNQVHKCNITGTIPKQQETSIFVSTSKNYLVNVNQNIITVFKSIDNNDKSATEIKLGYEEKN